MHHYAANSRRFPFSILTVFLSTIFLLPAQSFGQDAPKATPPAGQSADQDSSPQALAGLIRQLQAQVQLLNSQLKDIQAQQQSARAETLELRKELNAARAQLASKGAEPAYTAAPAPPPTSVAPPPSSSSSSADAQRAGLEERVTQLEENQQLENSKINEQSQTKVESGSKYRLRLTGIFLLNLYENRGGVDNQDFPQLAQQLGTLDPAGTFGGSLRQSQIGLEGFGPDIWGAHTSANIRFDFAGGFPSTPNGVATGIVRLRTGTIRFDWANTSIVAGQDFLFFTPLSPTSFASLAIPALSYSGELWSWTPQVRVEHRFVFSDDSKLLVQGGILDSFSGDIPQSSYQRTPSWGEGSGQPAYAARVAWSHRTFGQFVTLGVGGYYGRQNWGLGRNIDSWAGMADITLPLGRMFELSGQFYRGQALGGLGGGIGQNVLWNGPLTDPSTEVYGVNSVGGWAQLKYRMNPKIEWNGALGLDNPFASDLRPFNGNPSYLGSLFSKNLTPMANIIYRPRSDLVISFEYRYMKTYVLDSNAPTANHINLSLGYIF